MTSHDFISAQKEAELTLHALGNIPSQALHPHLRVLGFFVCLQVKKCMYCVVIVRERACMRERVGLACRIRFN